MSARGVDRTSTQEKTTLRRATLHVRRADQHVHHRNKEQAARDKHALAQDEVPVPPRHELIRPRLWPRHRRGRRRPWLRRRPRAWSAIESRRQHAGVQPPPPRTAFRLHPHLCVIRGPALGIAEGGIRPRGPLKMRPKPCRPLILVRVVFPGKVVIRLLDLLAGGVRWHAQICVQIILRCHLASPLCISNISLTTLPSGTIPGHSPAWLAQRVQP